MPCCKAFKKNKTMKNLIKLIILLTTLQLQIKTLAAETATFTSKTDVKVGFIGIFDEKTIDNPSDNVFTVNLLNQPSSSDEVWLSYELFGLSNHSAVSRSINNQMSVGGQLVKIDNNDWTTQKEQVNARWLKKGENIVRFSIPQNAKYNYKIRNLNIEVKKSIANKRAIITNIATNQIVVNSSSFLKGFVKGKNAATAKLFVDGKSVETFNSEFETQVQLSNTNNKNTIQLKAVFEDGETITEEVVLSNYVQADFSNEIADPLSSHLSTQFIPGRLFQSNVDEVELSINPDALQANTNISITSLRNIDMPPLDAGMVNVTKNEAGYRFLPHGTQFNNAASLSIAYDEQKIPQGYTAKNIKTYFFDEESKHWKALPTDTIEFELGMIVSKTTHFTDMINAVIQVPESPETGAHTPTSIKDIKAADPSANINVIQPPSANNMGNANLGYPIVIPPGRQGMQPQLGIQYNSGGGNGWLGLGWDLSIPQISIDTRWGVPRYNGTKETETYMLNGQQLTPVAHRGEFVDRNTTGTKQFYPRVEGAFNKIIRHGTNPSNYWWEITDKSGTVYSYGGTASGGIDEGAVLRTDGALATDNIANWALVEVRDLNDNFVKYHCTRQQDTGVVGGSVPGYNTYVNKITYTGNGTTEGKYEVEFLRDRDIEEDDFPLYKRKDVSIDGRLGMKRVNADLLKEIKVNYNKDANTIELVRSYKLSYITGAFEKTLLSKITEYDSKGNYFNDHTFDYYDDVKAAEGYTPLGTNESWDTKDDDVKGKLTIGNILNNIASINNASALGASISNGWGFGLAITAGVGGKILSKANSAGINFGFDFSNNKGLLALTDINGDNLPDKIFKEENDGTTTLYFRPNNGSNTFGDKVAISGITEFSKGKSNTSKWGFESHFGIFAGYQRSRTKSFNSIYFTDANGDQLVDIVNKGVVYFNRLDDNGVPTFDASSAETECVVCEAGDIDIELIEDEEAASFNPLHDVVKVWVAPFDGNITIDAPVNLGEDLSTEATADGVDVSIQHSTTNADNTYNATEIWTQSIDVGDFNTYTPNLTRTVKKGDRIYFRVQSVEDGNNDAVYWNQTITYDNNSCPCGYDITNETITCNENGNYDITFDVTLNNPISGSFIITVDGENIGTYPNTGNDNVETITLTDVAHAGNSTLAIKISDATDKSCRDIFYFDVADFELINSVVICGEGATYDLVLDVELGDNSQGYFYVYLLEGVANSFGPFTDEAPFGSETIVLENLTQTSSILEVAITDSPPRSPDRCAPLYNIDLTQCNECIVEIESMNLSCINSQQYEVIADITGSNNSTNQFKVNVKDPANNTVFSQNFNFSNSPVNIGPLNTGGSNVYLMEVSDLNTANCSAPAEYVFKESCLNLKTTEPQIITKNNELNNFITSFEGKQRDKGFALKWQSNCTNDKESFSIQKSLDGKTYETIHTQACIEGESTYEFIDENNNETQVIYKLVLVSSKNLTKKLGSVVAQKHNSNLDKQSKSSTNLMAKRAATDCTDVDANNIPIYQFNAADDFILSSNKPVIFPFNGTVQISGFVSKAITSDDVNALIIRNDNTIANYNLPFNSTASQPTNQTITVNEGDVLQFKLQANTTVDWTALEWKPTVEYTALDATLEVNENFDMSTIDLDATVEHTVFNKVLEPAFRWEAPQDGEITVTPQINTTEDFVFTIKKPLELVAEIINPTGNITIEFDEGDVFYFDYHFLNEVSASDYSNAKVSINNNLVDAGVYTLTDNYLYGINDPDQGDQDAVDAKLFGSLYRQWGQFVYEGNDVDNMIDEEKINNFFVSGSNTTEADLELNLENDACDPEVDVEQCITDMETLISNWAGNGLVSPSITPMVADLEKEQYAAYGPNIYIKADSLRSSRFGEATIINNPVTLVDGELASDDGKGAKAIKTLRISKNNSVNVSIGKVSVGYSGGNARQIYDYIDMNGDRHPDIVSDPSKTKNLKIQYTLPTGGLEDAAKELAIDNVQRSNHNRLGGGISGGFPLSTDQNSDDKSGREKSSDSEKEADMSVGLSFDVDTNNDKVQYDNMDINGDGLPDRVYKNGDVQLNLGYKFTDVENWGFNTINDGNSQSMGIGGNLGINKGNRSFVAGIGVSAGQNKIIDRLIDINGDGLLDMIDDIDDFDDTPDYIDDVIDQTNPCTDNITFEYCTEPSNYLSFTMPNNCDLDVQTQQITSINSNYPADFVSASQNDVVFQSSAPIGIHTLTLVLEDSDGNTTNVTVLVDVSNNCGDTETICDNINGNFETYTGPKVAGNDWINNNLDNWCVSHGSPSLAAGFAPSTIGMWMWAKHNGGNNSSGEGVFTDYNFQKNRSYTIEYSVYLYQNTDAQFLVEAANGLNCMGGLLSSNTIPTPASRQSVSTRTFTVEGEWMNVVETFTANSNFDHLWFYPRLNRAGEQVEVVLDNICITDNGILGKTVDSNSSLKKESQKETNKNAEKMTDLGVRLNTGNGFSDEVISWSGAQDINKGNNVGESISGAVTGCFSVFFFKLCFNPSGHGSKGISREKLQIRDVDGDSYPDYVYTNPNAESDASFTVKRSTIGKTNMLKDVNRPLGATITMDYNRVGNTYAMPNDVWALASVEINDGFEGDGANVMRNTFTYEDGFFNRCEREFYGFKNVKTHQHDTENNDAKYRTVEQNFINNTTADFTDLNDIYYLKGMLEKEVVQDAGNNKFTETVNSFALNTTAESTSFFPNVTETRNNFYEGGATAQKHTINNFGYDGFGNVISYTNSSDDVESISSTITYHPQTNNNNLVSISSSIIVKDGSGNTLRRRETTINNTTGNITFIRQYLEDGSIAKYDMTYFGNGNLKRITRPSNATGQRMFFDYTYDPAVQTYVTGVSDAYGYSSNSTYDFRFGQMLTSTDINGNIISYTVDDAGRIEEIRGPFEQTTMKPTIKFKYFPDADIPYATTKHYDPQHSTNDLETVTFMDGLMRPIQVKKDAAIYTAGTENEEMTVSGRINYDAFGRTIETYYPISETIGNATTFNTAIDELIPPTTTSYDVLDRPLNIELPDGKTIANEYDFDSGSTIKQFQTTITDANGIWKKQFTNSRGLTTSTLEQLSQNATDNELSTIYTYNAINELLSVEDDMGDAITYKYDWLGRRTEMDHPDGGVTTFEYDLASNVTKKITANLSAANPDFAINYTYDRERLTNITYPQNPQNNVTYTYGAFGADQNRAGRIIKQEDATGYQAFGYNALGATTFNRREVNVDGTTKITLETKWEYDTWNRLTKLTYPDGEELTYNYNLGGMLQSMSSTLNGNMQHYVKQLGYDKFEQNVYVKYGNNTETTYTYDAQRRWLDKINAKTAAGTEFMKNDYAYDNVGNISQITNSAPAQSNIGGPASYTFTYDDMYRLTNATGIFTGADAVENTYTLDMAYNNAHAIKSKNQTHTKGGATVDATSYNFEYAYNGAQPHAPTNLTSNDGADDDRQYTYDANGNQLSFSASGCEFRAYSWDEENRLMLVTDDDEEHFYTYDANGDRIIKNTQALVAQENPPAPGSFESLEDYTVYMSPYVVVRNGVVTKHFYTEGRRISSKLSGNYNVTNGTIVEPANAGSTLTYFFHPDHLGNSSYISDASGEVSQHIEYFPFGEVFIEEQNNTYNTPYLFNGKELDDKTGLYYYGARYYDPVLSNWLSVDPLASSMPKWSPYNYTFNNPVKYIDPDGRIPYPITIRSFAPFKTFGGGFHGDNRGFSNTRSYSDGRGPSARVHQVINFDTEKTSLSADTWSSPTWHNWRSSYKKTSKPIANVGSISTSSSCDAKTFNFDTHYAGTNPLIPVAPPIDVFSNFSITDNKNTGTLDISGKLTGDNFPSTEAFISDPSGQNVFIGVGFYEGSPFSSLSGENKDKPIMNFSFSITTNSDGNFTGVKFGDTNYSISDWNNLFLNSDPHKNVDK